MIFNTDYYAVKFCNLYVLMLQDQGQKQNSLIDQKLTSVAIQKQIIKRVFYINLITGQVLPMQNITVKVCYKSKNLIVGKGISTINQITKELAKRFPQVQKIKSSLIVRYQNGAEDLLSAYKLAEKQNKRFIKVKFSYEQLVDQSFISEKFDHTCVISSMDSSDKKENVTQFTKLQQNKPDYIGKEQPKSDVFQNLDDRFEIAVVSVINQQPFERKAQPVQQTLLVQPQKIQKALQELNPKGEAPQIVKTQISEIKTLSEKMENPIDYGLLVNDYFPPKEQKQPALQTKDDKRKTFEQLFGINHKKPQKKQESLNLNPDAMAVLEIIRKEFDTKILTLQAQYDDLRIKYNDMSSKYDNLSAAWSISKDVKVESKEVDIEKQHKRRCAEEIKTLQNIFSKYLEEPNSKTDSKIKNSELVEYFAEISQFQTIEQALVGDVVQSTFRVKNVGKKKWPENVFAQQQHSQQLLEIKSLQANESAIVTLETEIAKKIGYKINKMYQLVYFDEKNNLRKFGRIFGISVRIVEKMIVDPFFYDPKPPIPNPCKPNSGKNSEPFNQFRSYINEIMKKNKLVSKSLYDVIGCLKNFEVTQHSYKNSDKKTLIEFIKSICQ